MQKMKLIDKYTPSKGLMVVIIFLCIAQGLQLYTVTQVGSVEIIGNSIKSNMVTLVLFITYILTMISFLFILSEFFLMRKMESLFSTVDLQTIGKAKKEDLEDSELMIKNPEPVEEETVDEAIDPLDLGFGSEPSLESEIDVSDPLSSFLVSDDEDGDQKYTVLEVKIPEDEPEETEDDPETPEIVAPFDMDNVSVKSFVDDVAEPEAPEEEKDSKSEFFNESEILQTMTELKDVVLELKKRTGKA
jgi:hypothetical protein